MHNPLIIHNTPNLPRYFWHPSVVYIPEGFGGHRWWMAQSPYHPNVKLKPYQSRWELPCVHWSDDGVTWHSIPKNPIDDIEPELLKEEDFLSDPHLVYRDGILELYYRKTLQQNRVIFGSKTLLFKKTSTDGVNWSSRTLIVDLRKDEDIAVWGEQIISHAIVWTGEKYMCWYVDKSHYISERNIRMATSKDGVHWEANSVCTLQDYLDLPWHIDVQLVNGEYHMLCYSDKADSLSHLVSKDGLHWDFDRQILTHATSIFSFYSSQIYRSCLVALEDQYRVYFSAATAFRSYIGLVATKDWKHFEHIGPKRNAQFIIDTIVLVVRKSLRKGIKPFRKVFGK